MNIVRITCDNPDELLGAGVYGAGAKIRVERSPTGGGVGYSEVTTTTILTGTTSYTVYDSGGTSGSWYRSRYSKASPSVPGDYSDYSAEFQAGVGPFTSLATLRSYLNDELGVGSDADTSPFSKTFRNRALGQAYAELWLKGVWKPVIANTATVEGQTAYTITGIRKLERCVLIDSSGDRVDDVSGTLRQEGDTHVLVVPPLVDGYVLRAFGYTAYKSDFGGDADTDDLPAEYVRLPLAKARAICYRKALSDFARYGGRQTVPAAMQVTAEQLMALVATAEREFDTGCGELSKLRPRQGQKMRTWRF